MKTNVNFYAFREAFRQSGRENQFSAEGLSVLFDYLEQYEEACGEELELDVVALCCDFNESTFQEVADNYRIEVDYSDCTDDEEKAEALKAAVIEHVQYHSQLVGEVGDDSISYQAF